VTGDDEEIAASLPRPPLPAPARREAAIAEAMRRFHGGDARPAPAAGGGRPARPASWWSGPRRPYAGALAGAFLVAVIGLPFVWTAFDDYASDDGRRTPPSVEAPAREPVMADAVPSADSAAPALGGEADTPDAAGEVAAAGPAPPGRADPAPAAARGPADPAAGESEESAAAAAESEDSAITVTGSRIPRPNLESSVPVTSVGGDEIAVTGRRASRAARRGEWNACTVEDPGRNLDRCRRSIDPAAKGARGRTEAHLADGLSRAWTGDLEGATAALDRAIELAPRSSAAYLNRGLAWRRRGDLDRALADLDRAVRYAPRDARAYYYRSLVLRDRGDRRRARADEQRAVALDHRYAPLVEGWR